ncbi:AAA domain-containing protein [Aspergillus crustosus]
MYRNLSAGLESIAKYGEIQEESTRKRFGAEYNDVMETLICDEYSIIVTTPLLAGRLLDIGFKPRVLLCEEISYWRDPDLFGVLSRQHTFERVQFYGDHLQLGPPTFTKPGQLAWQISLMERLLQRNVPSMLLNIQYRTSARIYGTTSRTFYDGEVTSSPPIDSNQIHESLRQHSLTVVHGNFQYTVNSSLCFLNVRRSVCTQTPSKSWASREEASLAINLAKTLLQRLVVGQPAHRLPSRSITILCGYRGQVEMVNSLLVFPENEIVRHCLVQTVDEVQGSENDIIILTFGRCTTRLSTYLHAPRRVNVFTSRSKRAFFIIGDHAWARQNMGDHNKLQVVVGDYEHSIPDIQFVVQRQPRTS